MLRAIFEGISTCYSVLKITCIISDDFGASQQILL